MFFFHRFAPAAGCAYPLDFDVLLEQLAPASCHGADIKTQQFGNARVAAMAALQGFESGIQTSLFLIEDTEKEHDGRS